MKPTTVISVRGKDRLALLADPDFVYVGRAMPREGWKGSIWGNPFKVIDGRAAKNTSTQTRPGFWCHSSRDAVERFHVHLGVAMTTEPTPANLLNRFVVMAQALSSLKGKTLGCWCGCWEPGQPEIGCHAVVLAKLADYHGGIS